MKAILCRRSPLRKPYTLFHTYLTQTGFSCESNSTFNARKVFDESSTWNVVSATAKISNFAKSHRHKDAIALFSRMLLIDIRPNEFTFGTVIQSSIALKDVNLGTQFHGFCVKIGLQSNVFVGSAVLNLYAKLMSIEEARRAFEDTQKPNVVSYTTLITGYLKKERYEDALYMFDEMPDRNEVSWNAMISGFSQKGHNEEAVNLFIKMLREGFSPTQSTFPCVLTAAANLAALGIGRSFHACAMKSLGKLGVFVENSLVSFYAKCGSMEDCLNVFDQMPDRNTVSWNALICGYAQNGRAQESIDFFNKMQSAGNQPNSVTLLGVLLACNHGGFVDEGYFYFNQARTKNPSLLNPEHYACMVDLLSRSGRFSEAEKFISDLPFNPGLGFWKALLNGCQIHSNKTLSEFASEKILSLEPEDISSYVMLSNAHSAAGRWQDVSILRNEMREKKLKRIPGCSWIEIKSKIKVFVTRDRKHDESNEIIKVLGYFYEHSSKSNTIFCWLNDIQT